MKKLVLSLILSVFFLASYAQKEMKVKESEVPNEVKQGFNQEFPDATAKAWEKKDQNYAAKFKMNEKEHEAYFTPQGNLDRTKTKVKFSDTPQEVQDAFASSEYKDYNVKEAEEVETSDNKKLYEIEAASGKEKVKVDITPDGTITNTEMLGKKS